MFITFEGPEGSGKTTQIKMLAEVLRARGDKVLLTREPGGTRIAEQVREVLHRRDNREMDPVAEILLYSAARAQHTAELIRPALAAGQIVLCDRYYDSTLAYQGYGRGLDLSMLRTITKFATGGTIPDLTVYLDLAPEEGLRRRRDGANEWNRMDDEELGFHRRVSDGYQQLIGAEPDRWVIVSAGGDLDAVQLEVQRVVLKRLSSHV